MKLTSGDKALIRILVEASRLPTRKRPTLEGLSRKLGLKLKNPEAAIQRKIRKLDRYFEEAGKRTHVISKDIRETGKIVYWLDRRGLEPSLYAEREEPRDRTFLLLGELGLGTKSYDPVAMDGLAAFIRANNYGQRIDAVIIEGGLMPLVPRLHSKSNDEYLRYLGNNPEKMVTPKIEQMLHDAVTREEREYISKWLAHKILDEKDAAEFGRRELTKLFSTLRENVPVLYIHGEEDDNNMTNWKRLKLQEAKNLGRDYSEAVRSYVESKADAWKLQYKQDLLDLIESELEKLRKSGRLKKESERKGLKKEIEKIVNEFMTGEKELMDVTSQFGKAYASYLKKEEELPNEQLLQSRAVALLAAVRREVRAELGLTARAEFGPDLEQVVAELEKKIDAGLKECADKEAMIRKKISALSTEMGASAFYTATDPITEEKLFRETKNEYNGYLYDMASGSRVDFRVHTTEEKIVELYGIRFDLLHNPNFRSNAPLRSALEKLRLDSKARNKQGLEVPQIRVSAHGVGGFEAQAQPRYTESTVLGERRRTPEITMNIMLPTFQSYEKLQELREKGLRVWDTKRWNEHMFASGAVLLTVHRDGSHTLEYIDYSTLIEMGKVGRKLGELDAMLKRERLGERTRAGIKERIRSLEQKLRIETARIALMGDAHIGGGNVPGRPSNYDYIEAAQAWYRTNGMPNILIQSEMLDGSIVNKVDITKGYYGPLPKQLEARITELARSSASWRRKFSSLAELAIRAHEQIPITIEDLRVTEFKERCMPFVHDVLARGGKYIYAAGNHFSDPKIGRDEAIIITSAIDPRYKTTSWNNPDSDAQVFVGGCYTQRFGSLTLRLEGGGKLYVAHRLREGVTELMGAKRQLLRANIDVQMAVCFDRHNVSVGYADGTAYALAPGMQTWNPYVDQIGKQPGLRGVLDIDYDRTGRRYYRFRFVLDPALERPEYMRRIAEARGER